MKKILSRRSMMVEAMMAEEGRRSYQSLMRHLQKYYILTEGSVEGMCWDACLEMKRTFPELHWFEGWVILPVKENPKGRAWHNWMESKSGIRYDPTRQQFGRILKYQKVRR